VNNKYRLLIRKAGVSGLVFHQSYEGEARLEVRDLNTHVTIQVRAQELSPYRHTLLLNGAEYQILNVTRYAMAGMLSAAPQKRP
jgi:hypothetical protein